MNLSSLEFKVSLVYIVSFRTARAIWRERGREEVKISNNKKRQAWYFCVLWKRKGTVKYNVSV